MNEQKQGIVYILSNQAMPGLIKIGSTTENELKNRLSNLYSTGVPFPFECLWAGIVANHIEIEKLAHDIFADYRVNPKREFFNVKPERVFPLLKKLAIKELTTKVENVLNKNVTKAEQEAAKQYKRPPLNFEKVGIKKDSVLVYTKDNTIEAKVVAPKKVQYQGKEYSLTALTRKLLKLNYNVAPCKYWKYHNKILQDVYDETYK